MKIKFILVLLSCCFFFSCSSEKKKATPVVLLTEPQMVDVLMDVQIMEGLISYKKNLNQKTEYLRAIGYDTLFAHHGITDSIFKENIRYYNENEPYKLLRIMDSVEMRLTKMKN